MTSSMIRAREISIPGQNCAWICSTGRMIWPCWPKASLLNQVTSRKLSQVALKSQDMIIRYLSETNCQCVVPNHAESIVIFDPERVQTLSLQACRPQGL